MGGIALMVPGILDRAGLKKSERSTQQDEMCIVFQGDSITDAGRDRGQYYANNSRGMGFGYVVLTASELLGTHPDKDLKIYNRGISGHKVFQLANRWDLDALALKPDVLSILIGVNDFWHMVNGNYDGDVTIYENDLRALLTRTKESLPRVKLIIGEPFAVRGGRAINDKWSSFDQYRAANKKVAAEFSAAWIPYHQIFEEALKDASVDFWCPDGVHPSMAGAYLMKEAWMRTFKAM